ncbi:Trk system potassium transporter TrkA [Deferrisoma camini]|uniref:Trk system potassium transporter TrkA n=1 Tax=Deferrisoma camini TaxID=1035120 RepID=UPI00046D96AC|nr:Trk system potassium transporter TrkA [Deferrisoma camini]
MRVIVVGAGEVGFHTAERLALEGHDVVVVEHSRQALRSVEERLNVMALEGNGAEARVLEEAGIGACGLFIAVTDVDEVNLVACLLAKEYGVPVKIARVRSVAYTGRGAVLNAEKLGIELLINPLEAVAQDLINIASHAAAVEVAEFAGGRILFVGYPITPDSPVAGLTLAEIGELRTMYPFVVAAITRHGRTLIPRGDDRVEPDDHVFLVLRREDLAAVRYMFGLEKRQTRRIFVFGGGAVGQRVAEHFEQNRAEVTLVEPNRARCEELARRATRATVINADITEVDVLLSEGIGKADVVVATTPNEEKNILASLLAKRHGARRALCVVDRPAYVGLVPSLGIDACISPRLSTASAILKYVRRGGVLNMATVEENQAEVLELRIPEAFAWARRPLREIPFPDGAIVGAALRGDQAFIPTGDTTLDPGDRIVVFALPEAVVAVEDFFGTS